MVYRGQRFSPSGLLWFPQLLGKTYVIKFRGDSVIKKDHSTALYKLPKISQMCIYELDSLG